MARSTKQIVIVEQEAIKFNQVVENAALFNPDGSPYVGGETSPPIDGTDLSAIGLYLENILAWGEPGFVDPESGDDSKGWLALHAGLNGDVAVGYGADGNTFGQLRAGSTGIGFDLFRGASGAEVFAQATDIAASFRIHAASGQSVLLFELQDEAGETVFSVAPDGTIDPPISVSAGFPLIFVDDTDTFSITAADGEALKLKTINNENSNLNSYLQLGEGDAVLWSENDDDHSYVDVMPAFVVFHVGANDMVTAFDSTGLAYFPGSVGFNGVTPLPQAALVDASADTPAVQSIVTALTDLGLLAAA